jgi:Uncharacterized conserved protein (DUF2267)
VQQVRRIVAAGRACRSSPPVVAVLRGRPVVPGPRRPTHQRQTADEEEIAMTLDYDEFLAEVQRAELSGQDDAIRAIRAALETLAERSSGDEVRDLARHLPEPVRPCLHAARGAAARPTSWPHR